MKNLELVSARSRFGYTQTEVAEKMGITLQAYNAKELGVRRFTLLEVEELASILKLNIHDVNRIFFKNKLTECIRKKEDDNE